MTESKKQGMRIWIFRVFLVFSPFLLFIILFSLAEIGTRIYYAKTKAAFASFHIPPPLPVIAQNDASANQFSIPTTIQQKAQFKGNPTIHHTLNLDRREAYLKSGRIKDVFVLPPNIKKRLILRDQDSQKEIYNVDMETDAIGRRLTPDVPGKTPKKHLIFFGCSYTWGEGVGQNETLPYFTAAATKQYRAYNLGVNGGGISEAWAYTHVLDYFQNIPEQKGYAIYTFFNDHIPRYKGNTENVARWIQGRPYVRPDENGKIQFYGSWERARPFFVWASQWMQKSYLLKHIEFNFPPVQQQDIEDFVKVLKSVRQAYWDRFGSDNPFIVILYMTHAQPYSENLKAIFEREHIQYLDYSPIQLESLSDRVLIIPFDTHPNALAHKIVGEQIAEDLNLQ